MTLRIHNSPIKYEGWRDLLQDTNKVLSLSGLGPPNHEIALASRKAAVAARPPITIVCNPLRMGPVPV